MSPSSRPISPSLGHLFLACGALNFGGALLFAPPFPALRAAMGLPEAPATYLWILSLWILIFGLGYLDIGRRRSFEPTFLAAGAAGKATFSLLLITGWMDGELPAQAALSSLTDLLLAGFFVWLIVRRPTDASPRAGR